MPVVRSPQHVSESPFRPSEKPSGWVHRFRPVRDVDLRSWFADDELEPCPRCNELTALPTPRGGFRVCLACGLLNADGGAVSDLYEFAALLEANG